VNRVYFKSHCDQDKLENLVLPFYTLVLFKGVFDLKSEISGLSYSEKGGIK
jgi:hypothetical protein